MQQPHEQLDVGAQLGLPRKQAAAEQRDGLWPAVCLWEGDRVCHECCQPLLQFLLAALLAEPARAQLLHNLGLARGGAIVDGGCERGAGDPAGSRIASSACPTMPVEPAQTGMQVRGWCGL